jgi:hypothetical protein
MEKLASKFLKYKDADVAIYAMKEYERMEV